MSIGTIFDIARKGLFASQSAINVTGSNISNVNTPGYSRRRVNLEESLSLDFHPGQLGTGVDSVEVARYFDDFVEHQYTVKVAERNRYDALWQNLRSVDSLFNESETRGINTTLDQFWSDWDTLSSPGADSAKREQLVGNTQSLLNSIKSTQADLERMKQQMNGFIGQEVGEVNQLLEQIADLNKQIAMHHDPGRNNANALLDQRAQLVREVSQRIDVSYIDNGSGDFSVITKAGQTLVDGGEVYSLSFEGPRAEKSLSSASSFDGDIYFEGLDDEEYTVEVITGGAPGAGAEFRVSQDGGRTWMTDESGNEKHFAAQTDADGRVQVGDLKIWFGPSEGSSTMSGNLAAKDTFTITPKNGLYWHQTTSKEVNITPLMTQNGIDDSSRLTGGSLAGYFNFRDEYVGEYQDRLDTLANTLIWEVNRQHSQGAGTEKFASVTGTYAAEHTNVPLSADDSGLDFGKRLQSGNLQIFVYDKDNGSVKTSGSLNFSSTPGATENFDPSKHSLEDVRDAVNRSYGGQVQATITDGRLQISSTDPNSEFAFGSDTTGLLAGLGINTFFDGTSANDIAMNSVVAANTGFIATGHINGGGEANLGDNTTAKNIAGLRIKQVDFGGHMETLNQFYGDLVGRVGSDSAGAKYNFDFHNTLATELETRQDEVSGVNLDEELSNLIRYQHSYTAAAKLITTADQLMQTIIGLKN